MVSEVVGTMASTSSLYFSFGSLPQLIAICSIKLKVSNYLLWRTQFLQLMHTMKITDLVPEEPPKNDSDQSKKAYDDWEGKYLVMRSWMMGTITEECMFLTVRCKTTKEMWECLEEHFLQAIKDK